MPTMRISRQGKQSTQESSHLAAASGRSRLHALTLANLNCRFVVHCCCSHSFLNLPGHGQECLLNVGCALGRSLQEWDPKAIGEFLKYYVRIRWWMRVVWRVAEESKRHGVRRLDDHKPLQLCTPQLSCPPGHSCFRQEAC